MTNALRLAAVLTAATALYRPGGQFSARSGGQVSARSGVKLVLVLKLNWLFEEWKLLQQMRVQS